MDHLWTPWRFHYISSSRRKTACIFCRLASQTENRESFILLSQEHTFLCLNTFPYTTGHLLIVSRRHVATLVDLSLAELNEMIALARECERVLQEVYQPDGFNVGFNLGKSAGAGVAGHVHLHVVPRWEGDANFVSVIGQTRVVPEDLEATFDKLAPHFSS
jgi:ATP adenylyltransferase